MFIEWTPQGEDECGWVLADEDSGHTIRKLFFLSIYRYLKATFMYIILKIV